MVEDMLDKTYCKFWGKAWEFGAGTWDLVHDLVNDWGCAVISASHGRVDTESVIVVLDGVPLHEGGHIEGLPSLV